MLKAAVLAVAMSTALLSLPAHAVELTVFATGSMADPLKEVGEDFTRATGHTLRFDAKAIAALRIFFTTHAPNPTISGPVPRRARGARCRRWIAPRAASGR